MFHTMLRKENGNRAHHGNEYEAIFGHADEELISPQLAYVISRTWMNFVRCGEPKGAGLPDWPLYDKKDRKTMIISRESYVADGVRVRDMELFYPMFKETEYL